MSDANGSAPTEAVAQQTSENQGDKITGKITPSEAGKAQATTNEAKAAAREEIRRLKLKHEDGREEEVPEDEVLKIYKERKGHQQAANKRLQEAVAKEKKADSVFNMLKDKQRLFDALKELGHDPRQLSEEYLASVLEDEMLDPRDRELKEWRRKDAENKEREKKAKEAAEQKIHEEMKSKFSARYTEQFTKALDTVRVPKNKQTVAKMAEYISRAAHEKIEMTAEEAAQLVREDIQEYQRSIYGDMDAEEILKILGDQTMQKIRAHDIAKIKSPGSNLTTPVDQNEMGQRKRNTQGPMSPIEWRRFNRGR